MFPRTALLSRRHTFFRSRHVAALFSSIAHFQTSRNLTVKCILKTKHGNHKDDDTGH